MNTIPMGNYTLVAGEWVTTGEHTEDLLVSSSNITWDETNDAYKYTISVTWTGAGNCWIIAVGARLPVGYEYVPESAALFPGNLTTAEPPPPQIDPQGAYLVEWTFSKILIPSPGTRTQEFLINGSGELEGNYGWAEGERQDVGQSGELTGNFSIITATATKGGTTVGQVVPM